MTLRPADNGTPAPANSPAADYSYDEAVSRNIGWVTAPEQQVLRGKRAAIAGMGGVGGFHLTTLVRLGVGAFNVADFDDFELANFNRQIGASVKNLGRPKVDVLVEMARDINPELEISSWSEGINDGNIDAFLDGADIFIDGMDFFAVDVRAKVFQRCAELGIPAITAAPIGMGAAYLIFMPGGMTFEEYFRLNGLSRQRQYVNFFLGLAPKGLQSAYLMDPSRLDLAAQKGPSSVTGCELCAGVAGAEAVKILLGRGPVRAAPVYHQFDAYRGKFLTGRLRGGNRNPLQQIKLRLAYRHFEGMSRESWPEPTSDLDSEILQILDMARWAPSGDNTQPWRFEIVDDSKVVVHVRDQAEEDIYDYNGGQPTLLSTGMLLETMRIAASEFGRNIWWGYMGASGHDHRVEVQFPKTLGTIPNPLLPYITARSVNRNPYRTRPLGAEQKAALADALGGELEVRWHESARKRWRMARLSGMATDIRLRIPEAFRVHQRVLDWERKFSPDGIPATAVGLDAVTLKIMRWAMANWQRTARMNRLPGATLLARMQMDYLPGVCSAAHFIIRRKHPVTRGEEICADLRAGEALQRFWLTACQAGLVLQPSMATAIFAYYGRNRIRFTASAKIRARALNLATRLADAILRGGDDHGFSGDLVFLGRIGTARDARLGSRSVRRPLKELITGGKEAADATAGGPEVRTLGLPRQSLSPEVQVSQPVRPKGGPGGRVLNRIAAKRATPSSR